MQAMKQADLQELQNRAAELAKASSVGDRVRNVTVEGSGDDETGEYLRVQVELTDIDRLPLDELRRLMQAIEDALTPLDERFPSVRFSEAA
jgi:hypothetical protein